MFTFVCFVFVILLCLSTVSGCGTYIRTRPTLGLFTPSGNVNYQSNGVIYASVKAGGQWTDWRRIDNLGCDDLEVGWDFFPDFTNIYDEWQEIAIQNCNTDGWMIGALSYWDGSSSNNVINRFCSDVLNTGINGQLCASDSTQQAGVCGAAGRYNQMWLDSYMCREIRIDLENSINGVGVEGSGAPEPPQRPDICYSGGIITSSGSTASFPSDLQHWWEFPQVLPVIVVVGMVVAIAVLSVLRQRCCQGGRGLLSKRKNARTAPYSMVRNDESEESTASSSNEL